MQEEIWFQDRGGLKFVEYLGDGADEAIKTIGIKFQNALSSDNARKMYASQGNIVFLLDCDEVVANTYYSPSSDRFTLFLEHRNAPVSNHRYLMAFYRMLDERGLGGQFVDTCMYTVNRDGRKEELEKLFKDFSSSA